MKHCELLKQYNELKNLKLDPSKIAKVRTKLLNSMYEEVPDFKNNHQVKVLLNEELSHFRKMNRNSERISNKEITVPYVLYRYLVENASSPDHLKNNFKRSELELINDCLTPFSSCYEFNLLEYFTYKFDKGDHFERMRAVLYYSLRQVDKVLGEGGSMSLDSLSVENTLVRLRNGSDVKLTQSDYLFKETNEKGYAKLQEVNSIAASMGLFILNFEKGNKGYAKFYLKKLVEALDEDSIILPLLNVVDKEFLC